MSKAELILIAFGLVFVFCLSVAALAIADAKSKTPAALTQASNSLDAPCFFRPQKHWGRSESYIACTNGDY